MTSAEFIKAGVKLTGIARGYQLPLAEKLGISIRTVKSYASGDSLVPLSIEYLIKELSK